MELKVLLTEIARQVFPCVSLNIVMFFYCLFTIEPQVQTFQVDVFHRPPALARADEGVDICLVIFEADPTLNWIFIFIRAFGDPRMKSVRQS